MLQASPANAYNAEGIVKHALAYCREFEAVGISKDRFCIKILTTGPGMLAAQILEKQHGISTLGTGLFSVPQALAAAQAGCLYISPYFNEILAHFTPVPERLVYEVPEKQHPMSARMAHIYQAYRELVLAGKCAQPPVIKSASFIAMNEVLAMPALGSQQATILAPTLVEMCSLQTAAAPGVRTSPARPTRSSCQPLRCPCSRSTRCARTARPRHSTSQSTTSPTTLLSSRARFSRTPRRQGGSRTPSRSSRRLNSRRVRSSRPPWPRSRLPLESLPFLLLLEDAMVNRTDCKDSSLVRDGSVLVVDVVVRAECGALERAGVFADESERIELVRQPLVLLLQLPGQDISHELS